MAEIILHSLDKWVRMLTIHTNSDLEIDLEKKRSFIKVHVRSLLLT